jgi:hypothetical protein
MPCIFTPAACPTAQRRQTWFFSVCPGPSRGFRCFFDCDCASVCICLHIHRYHHHHHHLCQRSRAACCTRWQHLAPPPPLPPHQQLPNRLISLSFGPSWPLRLWLSATSPTPPHPTPGSSGGCDFITITCCVSSYTFRSVVCVTFQDIDQLNLMYRNL